MDHLTEAVRIVGGIGKLAAALGVVQSAASNWRRRGGVPLEYCAAIERLTDGKVAAEQLRAGCWRRVPDSAWPHPEGRPVLDFAGRIDARLQAGPMAGAVETTAQGI